MEFVKQKLLNGESRLGEDDRSGSLAWLSVRFAFEFNKDGTAGNVVRTQVERHASLGKPFRPQLRRSWSP